MAKRDNDFMIVLDIDRVLSLTDMVTVSQNEDVENQGGGIRP
jgi:hypothetical protein